MKKFLSLIIIILALAGASADAAARIPVYRVGKAYLFFDKSSGEITGFAGEPDSLEIPSEIGGYRVTSIGKSAFANCRTLKYVKIPAAVVYIGDGAFGSCAALSRVVFEGAIENIPLNAFEGTPWAAGSGGEEFVIAGKTLLLKYNGAAADVIVPAGVKKIAPNAFAYNACVERVALPEGLVEIGDNAFVHCYSLSGIYFPASITSIGLGAFDDTIWLRKNADEFVQVNGVLIAYNGSGGYVTVPEGITSISSGVFMFNDKLIAAALPETIRAVNDAAFGQCENLKAVLIPDGVERIDDYAFSGSDGAVLYGNLGSYAEYYASVNGIPFSAPINIIVDGEAVSFDAPSVIIGEASYAPARAVLEALGAEVYWDEQAQTAVAQRGNTLVSMGEENDWVTVNGERREISAPIILLKGRTMAPVRALSEIFGARVGWDGNSRTIIIESRGGEAVEEAA